MFHIPDFIDGPNLPIMRHAYAALTKLASVFSMAGNETVMKRSLLAFLESEGWCVFRDNTNDSGDIPSYTTRKRSTSRMYKTLCKEGLRIDPNKLSLS